MLLCQATNMLGKLYSCIVSNENLHSGIRFNKPHTASQLHSVQSRCLQFACNLLAIFIAQLFWVAVQISYEWQCTLQLKLKLLRRITVRRYGATRSYGTWHVCHLHQSLDCPTICSTALTARTVLSSSSHCNFSKAPGVLPIVWIVLRIRVLKLRLHTCVLVSARPCGRVLETISMHAHSVTLFKTNSSEDGLMDPPLEVTANYEDKFAVLSSYISPPCAWEWASLVNI